MISAISYNPRPKITMEEIEKNIEEAHPGLLNRVDKGLNNLELIDDTDILNKLYVDVSLYHAIMRNYISGTRSYFPPPPLTPDEERIMDRIEKITPELYKNTIVSMIEKEEINGYKLMHFTGNFIDYSSFKIINDIWDCKYKYTDKEWIKQEHPVPDLTEKEFMELYNKITCTDWSKMDEHGECFGGFWQYPEGSLERENAFELTGNKNGRCLWKLPFPKYFLIKTIEIGCGNREESVRYSNHLGVWMSRKREIYKD
jgi:hypothetical protein